MMKMSPPKYFFFFPAPYFKSTCKMVLSQYQGKDLPLEIHSMKLLIERGFVLKEMLRS